MGSTPDYTTGKEPQTVLQSPLASIKPVNAETDTTTSDGDSPSFLNLMFSKATSPSSDFSSLLLTLSPSEYIQHVFKNLEIEPILGSVSQIHQEMMLRSTFMSEKLQIPIEKQTKELVRKLTAPKNAKQITFRSASKASKAFRRFKGDSSSPEVH
ncbi:hypothetical protein BGZ65_000781, partial [Modicella reniformis]